jgi:hypothetical protein
MSLPHTNIELLLLPESRQLNFSKELLEIIDICRRTGGEAASWEIVAHNARSPFLDPTVFPSGTLVEYYVLHMNQHGEEVTRSNLVRTTLP